MRQRIVHWLAVLAVIVTLGFGLAMGGGQPQVVHGESSTPTPTPTETTDGQPGGDGGGHF
jgi:hypothetical protein